MPPEWAPHERTLMAWPARTALWGEHLAQAKADYAEVANAIAGFEPVLMAADPALAEEARAACGAGVDVVPIALDDSWARDSGPVFVTDAAGGRRVGVDFGFNAWGEKFRPYADDAAFARRVLEHLGEERVESPLILEGGSIAVDGAGTLLTTEQCLLHPSRNPSLSRERIEAELVRALGVERVVWLGRGLVEDLDTDGHVDNCAAFLGPGRVLIQTAGDDEANPNFAPARENVARARAAGLEVVELPWLPYVEAAERPTVVPYANFYLCNGAVVVPVRGAETDPEALAFLGSLFPGREVVPAPGTALAHGGGGVHCITQQVPAVAG